VRTAGILRTDGKRKNDNAYITDESGSAAEKTGQTDTRARADKPLENFGHPVTRGGKKVISCQTGLKRHSSAEFVFPIPEGIRSSHADTSLSERYFDYFSQFIHSRVGIRLPREKKIMLEVRLQKRMRALGIHSFKRYAEFVFSPEGMKTELPQMIDAITTNKTDFFREPGHFTFLTDVVLPSMLREGAGRNPRKYNFWSAGCSSGEEPYTLGMVLEEFAASAGEFAYSIIATDICNKVLEKARKGIYDSDRIEPIPLELRKKYLLRSKDRDADLVRMVPQIRQNVSFRRLNFMDDDFGITEAVDVIFCRNVMIYFDRPTQERVIRKFCDHLQPGGFLFIGHSESLTGMDTPLLQVASTIYRKLP
jgi:chemotaxis protein methyltransferase CheR